MSNASVERLSRLEGQYLVMQSQMIGMQSSLDRILSAVQPQSQITGNGMSQAQQAYSTNLESSSRDGVGYAASSSRRSEYDHDGQGRNPSRPFPPLPGFAPPPHKYATYGIVPSTAPSSDDESEDTLPRATMNAPIEALQGLANAAAEAAAVPSTSAPR
jgi:hypothetical protein